MPKKTAKADLEPVTAPESLTRPALNRVLPQKPAKAGLELGTAAETCKVRSEDGMLTLLATKLATNMTIIMDKLDKMWKTTVTQRVSGKRRALVLLLAELKHVKNVACTILYTFLYIAIMI